MTIVITMGGLGSRFREAGYTVPKYQIEAKGKTLFELSMISLTGFSNVTKQYIFLVRKEDNTSNFIENQCIALGINNISIIELEKLTDGQATTAMLASNIWEKEDSLLIYNIDTYVEANQMNQTQISGDGFIPCFHGEGDHWSFVQVGQDGNAIHVAEKKRISNHCTLGAYYFKSCGLYEDLYQEYYQDNESNSLSEKYVAPLYQHLIDRGGLVKICSIDKEYVHVLGTPEELEEWVNNSSSCED